jgi:hypothetical protein
MPQLDSSAAATEAGAGRRKLRKFLFNLTTRFTVAVASWRSGVAETAADMPVV